MRVLIAGASGLVGGRLLRRLSEMPDVQVRAAGRSVRVWSSGVEGVVTDLTRPQSFTDACRDMDVVINLASMGEQPARLDPQMALRANAGGTLALASAATETGATRFIQLSTFKVYGQNPTGSINEASVCRPRSHYAATHYFAETYATWQHPACVVFRLANGFGAPATREVECWDIIVNEMCRQAVVDRRIAIRSSGQAWRSFVPLGDVVHALVGGLRDIPPGTYNLGGAQSMRIADMAHRVAQVCERTLGYHPEVRLGEPEASLAQRLDYRIDKLEAAGYGPTTSMDDEIAETLLAARDRWTRA